MTTYILVSQNPPLGTRAINPLTIAFLSWYSIREIADLITVMMIKTYETWLISPCNYIYWIGRPHVLLIKYVNLLLLRSFVDFQIIEEVNDLLSSVKCYGGRGKRYCSVRQQ